MLRAWAIPDLPPARSVLSKMVKLPYKSPRAKCRAAHFRVRLACFKLLRVDVLKSNPRLYFTAVIVQNHGCLSLACGCRIMRPTTFAVAISHIVVISVE